MKKRIYVFLLFFLFGSSMAEVKKPDWVMSEPNSEKNESETNQNQQPKWISANSDKQPFSNSNFNADNYSVPQNLAPQRNINSDNVGVSALPPLSSPYEQAKEVVSPLTQEEIEQLREIYDSTRKAKYENPINTLPRISSQTVDLSPGSSLPIVRTMPNETSTIVFIDSAGAPWPIAAIPRVSNPNAFDVEWLENSSSVIISARNMFQQGNLTVFLHGLTSPVVVRLATSDEATKNGQRIVDYRLDLRLPYRGPNSQELMVSESKIGIYDDNLQAFLDGVPPVEAKRISFSGVNDLLKKSIQVWLFNDSLFIRTNLNIQNAFDKTISSSDGTKVFNMPKTPFVTLSDSGKKIVLQLNI